MARLSPQIAPSASLSEPALVEEGPVATRLDAAALADNPRPLWYGDFR
jgi:hypothetical protein